MKLIIDNNNYYEPKDVVRIIREWCEMTQADFAESICKSTSTIQSIEEGRRNYMFNTLLDMVKKHKLKITIEKMD